MCSALQCPRLTVHKHLVASLLLFYSSLLVYLEPYVTQRKQGLDYRQYVSIIRSTERGLLKTQQVLNRQIGSPKSSEFQKNISRGKN
jgi:hypothetical protein